MMVILHRGRCLDNKIFIWFLYSSHLISTSSISKQPSQQVVQPLRSQQHSQAQQQHYQHQERAVELLDNQFQVQTPTSANNLRSTLATSGFRANMRPSASLHSAADGIGNTSNQEIIDNILKVRQESKNICTTATAVSICAPACQTNWLTDSPRTCFFFFFIRFRREKRW